MKKRLLLITSIVLATVVISLPLSQAKPAFAASYTNSTFAETDSSTALRTVNVSEPGVVTDLNISISFTKTDGVCADPGSGDAYHDEIEFVLISPSGTRVVLVNSEWNDGQQPAGESAGGADKSSRSSRAASTYTGGGDIGDVTIYLDDEAGSVVGGVDPVSGTFRPFQPLAAFDGENPNGVWTLEITDAFEADVLCFYAFTLVFPNVVTGPQCGNFGDGRINNTDKDCIPPFVVYCIGTAIEIYDVDYTTSHGTLLVRWSKADYDEIGIPEGGPVELASFPDMSFWRLDTGEFLGSGFTPEGKPYIFVWNGCPASDFYHLAN